MKANRDGIKGEDHNFFGQILSFSHESRPVVDEESIQVTGETFPDGEHNRETIPSRTNNSETFILQSGAGNLFNIIESEVERNIAKKHDKSRKESKIRRLWVQFTKLLTLFVPDKLISSGSSAGKMAWREKTSLCMLITGISTAFLFYIALLPQWLCPDQKVMSVDEVKAKPQYNPHIIIHGKVYDLTELAEKHSRNSAIPHQIYEYAGKDASFMFPRFGLAGPFDTLRQEKLAEKTYSDRVFEPHYHSAQDLMIAANWPVSYDLCFSPDQISKASTREKAWIVIDLKVYSITEMLDDLEQLKAKGILPGKIEAILSDSRYQRAVAAPWGRDKTNLFRYSGSEDHIAMLLDPYMIGVVDFRDAPRCIASNYLLLGSTAIMVFIMLVKFFASLQLGVKREPEKLDKYVALLIPCYTEDESSLRKTIDSMSNLNYDDSKKVMFLVADGNVIGQGNELSTPEYIKKILGIEDDSAISYEYFSISPGHRKLNKAKVFSGFYETGQHNTPFVLIVKTGMSDEYERPGNRGKRDSQMIIMRFLSKANFDLPMAPLEIELYKNLWMNLGVDPCGFEYLMMVDADTEIFSDSLNRLLSCCVHDSKIIGICGETRISNEKTSWITMIQVYEYFISHHMSKAFESLFGCVTCLPGCFCMYRLKNSSQKAVLLLKPELLDEYSETSLDTLHQKNLLSLGEDRYLTTLVLKHFPNHRTKFTSDAVCKTVVPENWSVLLSQRRRWINSTIHNLFELLLLPNLCGFCCFSMRFIIFMDLFSTIIFPATVLYMIFLILQTVQRNISATISLLMLSLVYGLQTVIFILKRQWQHIGWMVVYLFALPIFGFFIPIYAFWHFDDFTWGTTRKTQNDSGKEEQQHQDDSNLCSHGLVLRTWSEYEEELNAVDDITCEYPSEVSTNATDNPFMITQNYPTYL